MEQENNCPVAEQIEESEMPIQTEYAIGSDGSIAPSDEANSPVNPETPSC